MACCINHLAGSSLEIFENIISLQYVKFIKFYRLIEKYLSNIDSMEYGSISQSSLDVILIFKNDNDLKSIKSDMLDYIDTNNYDGDVKISKSKNKLSVSIRLNED